jgi:Na+/H+ antiporter NhaC
MFNFYFMLHTTYQELMFFYISNLQRLPALTVLSLYVQRRTSTESISFVMGAFAALEYFEFRCGVICLAFEEGAMPSLQRIKLGFNAHRGEQYGCLFVGIKEMLSVQKISVLIGSAVGAKECDIKAAESAVQKAIGKHHSNVSIERTDMVDEEFDPPEVHHSIQGKQPSTSSEKSRSEKQGVQENIEQKADTNS